MDNTHFLHRNVTIIGMIIIINGPCGIGKTTAAWAVQERFDRAVMLDGDYICAVHPSDYHNPDWLAYQHTLFEHLIEFHQKQGAHTHFVINYVFEKPDTLNALTTRLARLEPIIHVFRLVADEAAIEARIRGRNKGDDLAWYLNRFRELVAVQNDPAVRDHLGMVIDTTSLSPDEVADAIMSHV